MTTEELKRLIIDDLYLRKGGIVAEICRAANISRQTFYRWRKEDPAFAEALTEARESLLDFVEAKLMKQIDESNLTAIIFFLKCQAKKRGYVERQEWSGPDGGAIPVKMYDFNPSGYPLALLSGKPQKDGEEKHDTEGTKKAEKKAEGAEKGPDGETPRSKQDTEGKEKIDGAVPGAIDGSGVQPGVAEETVTEDAQASGGEEGRPDKPQ